MPLDPSSKALTPNQFSTKLPIALHYDKSQLPQYHLKKMTRIHEILIGIY